MTDLFETHEPPRPDALPVHPGYVVTITIAAEHTSPEALPALKTLLESHPGMTPVRLHFRFADHEADSTLLPKHRVHLTTTLIAALQHLLGNDAVHVPATPVF